MKVKNLHDRAREATLRHLRRTLHEEHKRFLSNELLYFRPSVVGQCRLPSLESHWDGGYAPLESIP